MRQAAALRAKAPLLGAGAVLALLWFLWLTDLHPHFSTIKSHSSVESWWPHKSTPDVPNLNEHQSDAIAQLPSNGTSQSTAPKDRPLILFAFFETELSKPNFEYFLKHGLHDAADFLFIINGDTQMYNLIPDRPNIRYVRRKNDCYDMGAMAEILLKDDLYKKYQRFVTLNASVRGPFFPAYSNSCWSDVYLSKITDKVKLVGMTLACRPSIHVQSMVWATDRIGMEILLNPSPELTAKFMAELPPHDDSWPIPAPEKAGIASCPHEYWKAVSVEVFSTPLIRSAGYEVDVMMTAYSSIPEYEVACRKWKNGDVLLPGTYWDMSIHPFDTIFIKTNRGVDPVILNRLTEWTDNRKYSSYDYCH